MFSIFSQIPLQSLIHNSFEEFAYTAEKADGAIALGIFLVFPFLVDWDYACFFPNVRHSSLFPALIEDSQ